MNVKQVLTAVTLEFTWPPTAKWYYLMNDSTIQTFNTDGYGDFWWIDLLTIPEGQQIAFIALGDATISEFENSLYATCTDGTIWALTELDPRDDLSTTYWTEVGEVPVVDYTGTKLPSHITTEEVKLPPHDGFASSEW